jgi:hypothetical membrane protein
MIKNFVTNYGFNKAKLFGILSFFTFIIFVSIAIIAYSNYDFFNQNLSELGVGNNGFIFNFGIMLTSIFLFIYFYFKFYKNNKIKFISGLISAVGLFGVGFFPLTNNLHYFFTGLFFVILFLIILITSINLFKEKKFNLFIINILCVLILFLYMFILRIPLFQKLAVLVIIIYYLINLFLG